MRILVTGGLGFIGSHLAHALVEKKHALVILDDLSTGKREYAPKGCDVIIDDVARAHVFDDIVKRVDACFHLAAIASVERSRTEWLRTHQVNAGGLVNLFDAIRRAGKPIPVVFASSAAIYGNNAALPLKEITHPAPISSYGADKLTCEKTGDIAAHVHGIPNIGLRFFNVFGPRQDPASPYSGVISIFTRKILNGEPLTVYGDGEQSRDFIYVNDVIQAMMSSLDELKAGDIRHEVFNVCTGESVTIHHLANTLASLAGEKPDIRYAPARNGDIRHSAGDPGYAAQALQYKATTPLADGLRLTLDWLKAQS